MLGRRYLFTAVVLENYFSAMETAEDEEVVTDTRDDVLRVCDGILCRVQILFVGRVHVAILKLVWTSG